MRHVALAFVILFIAAALPAPAAAQSSADECSNSLTSPNPCLRVSTQETAAPDAAKKTYYLWAAAYRCAPRFSEDCSGVPAAGTPVWGFVGVLYEEANGLGGLQRAQTFAGGKPFDPDNMVLL